MAEATSVEDFLEHHGVKGMKWGQRKAARNIAKAEKREAKAKEDNEIVNARLRQQKRVADLNVKAAATYSQTTKKGLEAATKSYERAEKKLINNPDNETAARMTSGEKSVARLQTGLALVGIASIMAGAAYDFARR